MKRVGTILMTLTIAFSFPAAATPWSTTASCTVQASGADQSLAFIATARVDEDGARSEIIQVRMDTTELLLAEGERTSDASLVIPGHGEFAALDAHGSSVRDGHRTTIRLSNYRDFLLAASRGATLAASIPSEAGARELSFDLAGSAIALRQLERCLN